MPACCRCARLSVTTLRRGLLLNVLHTLTRRIRSHEQGGKSRRWNLWPQTHGLPAHKSMCVERRHGYGSPKPCMSSPHHQARMLTAPNPVFEAAYELSCTRRIRHRCRHLRMMWPLSLAYGALSRPSAYPAARPRRRRCPTQARRKTLMQLWPPKVPTRPVSLCQMR
jgi:hypothetical protein